MTNMTDDLDTLRKRLDYRAHHRGTKEMDFVLGAFAEAHLPGYDGAMLERFAAVLEESDADMLSWVTGQAPVPDSADTSLIGTIVAFANRSRTR